MFAVSKVCHFNFNHMCIFYKVTKDWSLQGDDDDAEEKHFDQITPAKVCTVSGQLC